MKIAVLKERREAEKRVAAIPEIVKKWVAAGHEVVIEKGAGLASSFRDEDYEVSGARVAKDLAQTIKDAAVVLKVQSPVDKDEMAGLKSLNSHACLIGMFSPLNRMSQIQDYLKQKFTVLSLDMAPRITRAQNIDVLSSQTNLAGYRSVIEASAEFGRIFPMMMTAAGTIPPAKVLVLGAGVAGLQAIATARRLGAVVSAFDVRPVVKEQVESLGARFVEVSAEESGEDKSGYAKEMGKDYQKRQEAKIAETLAESDIAITTALIPGRPAPTLITEPMVKAMKPGSVILDMAVEMGGNCPLSELDKVVTKHDVKIIGYSNLPSRVARDASTLYARNMNNFLGMLLDEKTKKVNLDFEDEIIKNVVLTHEGKVVSPMIQKILEETQGAKNS